MSLVEHVLIYRVKESRLCPSSHKKERCFGICKSVGSGGSNDKSVAEMCPVLVEALDEALNQA